MTQDVWASAHLEAMRRGLGAPHRATEMVAYCEAMAQAHPQDAQAWLWEAAQYQALRGDDRLDEHGWREMEEQELVL